MVSESDALKSGLRLSRFGSAPIWIAHRAIAKFEEVQLRDFSWLIIKHSGRIGEVL
jgi:hypothetical protein